MQDPRAIVILPGARTAMIDYTGAFSDVSALELGAIAAKGALERSGVKPEWVDHCVMGNALQTSGDAIYGARHVALKAGCPLSTPALTLNRLCGSGIQSVVTSAEMLLLGESSFVLAGGMENMTQAPHVIRGARKGFRLGQGTLEDSLMVALKDTRCNMMMAETAEKIAKERSIPRQAQDEYALRSHTLGAAAVKSGVFKDEIVSVTVKVKGKPTPIDQDDHIKPETTLEGLAALPAAFGKDGTVTAGNASGIVDGAACVVMTTADLAQSKKLAPMGRIVSWGICGVEPSTMGLGPVPAIRQALERAGLSLKDLDLIEVNEAFSAQYLAVEKDLGLDREKTNVNGGAIALGHPLAATGTRLVLTLLHELRRRKGRYGVASACIGGGQGIAIVVERV
jgi:acetyl-CoA acetyltransferase family protein